MTGPSVKIKYIREDVDRHGNVRLYFQRHRRGLKVRIDAALGTPEFYRRYHELLAGAGPVVPANGLGPQPDTYRWLCAQYLASRRVRRELDPRTLHTRRGVLEATFDEPVYPGATETFADFPLARITTKVLRVLRDRKDDLPEAANNRVKAIRAVFKWALKEELITTNPARDLEKVENASTGWHSWEVEEVRQYEACHPIGTKARLVLALLIYTGVRRSDVVLLGRQHRRIMPDPETGVLGPWLKFTQHKNRNRKPVTTQIPVLPQLDSIMETSPVGDLTFLVTDYGQPFTSNGFGNKFRAWCNEAGLPHCSAHGLRKASARNAAENGATTRQLMSVFGWLSMAEAERYTREADRKRMAGQAMGLVVQRGNEKSPTG